MPWLTTAGLFKGDEGDEGDEGNFGSKLGQMVDSRSVSVRFGSPKVPRLLRVIPIEAKARGRKVQRPSLDFIEVSAHKNGEQSRP